jgi:hypothetical protein
MSNIQRESLLRTSYAWRTSVILTAIIASVAAGASLLAYPSVYSPLAVIVTSKRLWVSLFSGSTSRFGHYMLPCLWFSFPSGSFLPNIHSIFNRSMAVAALAIWLFDVLTQHRRVQWTSTATFLVGFLVWGTVTLIWAEDLGRGVTLLQTYALRLILFLFLIPNAIKTRHDLNGLMNTLALAGWVLVLVSMGTILKEGYIAGTRLSVLGVNENSLGILAMLTMLGVLWQAIQSSKQHRVSQ